MAKVFVSHAHEDAAVAQRIAAFLEEQGMPCWIAPRDVPAGLEYGAAILEGIERSDVLLLVLSERSNESHFVRREVERAVSKTKPVLPVRIREVAPSGALEFFISQAQWVDAWQPPMERHLAQLLAAIKALTGGAPAALPQTAPKPTSAPAAATPSPRRRRALLVGGLFLLLALAGGLLAWSPWRAPAPLSASGPGPAANGAAVQGEARPAPAAFLAGTWCQPMSGGARAVWRFTALAADAEGDRVAGELTFSHSADTQRFEARAVWTAGDRLALTWLAPAELVGASPLALATDGADRLTFVLGAGDDVETPPEPLTRCQG